MPPTVIYTFYIGLPELLVAQAKCIRKFIPDAQQICVIHCKEIEDEQALIQTCDKLALLYIVRPGVYKLNFVAKRGSTVAHTAIVSEIWKDKVLTNPHGIVVFMDCDIVPIKPFNFAAALNESTIIYRPFPHWAMGSPTEQRYRPPPLEPIPSAWRNFFIVNLDKMKDIELVQFLKHSSFTDWLIAHPKNIENHKTFDRTSTHVEGIGGRELFLDAFVHLGRVTGYSKLKLRPTPEQLKAFCSYLELLSAA